MANKRTLKHQINLVCEELTTECIAASLYGNDAHEANADALLFSIIKMQCDFICRVGHPEPGMKPRLYYKTLREKFATQVIEITDQISNL